MPFARKARLRELRDIQAQYARIAPLMKKLKENPDDPDTNLKIGRYFCFSAGNWDKGLPMFAKGSDLGLKGLAEIEATHPTEIDAQIKLADGWWDKSANEQALAVTKCKDRACYWYDKARAASHEELPDRILQRLATLSRSIDLLATMDLDKANEAASHFSGLRGGWKRDHGMLLYTGGNTYIQTLELPYRPVGDYDFIVDFTINRGNGGITQIMPVKGLTIEWVLNEYFANFEPLALRPGSFGPIQRGNIQVVAGQHYSSVVQFRHNGVRALVNGAVIREWPTNYNELGQSFGSRPADRAASPCVARAWT